MTTALQTVSAADNTVKIIARRDLLIASAGRAVIDSQETMERGADLAKQLKSLAKIADEERITLVRPLKEAAKEIDEQFKAITLPLTNAAKDIENKMFIYTKEQERIAREQQEARRKAEEEARKAVEVASAPSEQSALQLIPSVATVAAIAVPQVTRGVMGASAGIRKTWAFELVDILALAQERPDLVTVDTVRVNAEIRGKGGEIAGLRIFQQESMSVR